MPANELVEGRPRLGWMIDGDPNTPNVAVMLQLTDEAIVLTIPTRGDLGPADPYGRWFTRGIHVVYNGQTLEATDPPRVLKFHDPQGTVTLVGCRAVGSRSLGFVGNGRVVANYAVMGDHRLDIEEVNGIRTEMPALAAWTRIGSTTRKTVTDAENRVQELTITLRSPDPTRLSREKNLTLQPSWRTSAPEHGTFSAHEVVQLVSHVRRPQNWDAHLTLHRAMQDLLSLSAWHAFGYSRVEVGVLSGEHPRDGVGADTDRKTRWSEVVTHRLRTHESWQFEPRFLFTYEDLGPRGVRRWLDLRRRYERALLPLVGIVDQRGMFAETRVMQTGIAIEALGFQLATDSRSPRLNNRGQINYDDAIRCIIDDMPVTPLEDMDDWRERSRLAYRAVKHADKAMPDALTIANAYRENALVLRCWLASRLGTPDAVLRDRLFIDPLRHEFTAVG